MVLPKLEEENAMLKNQIELMKQKIERLRVENVVTVIKQKEVLPLNYDSDMQRLNALEIENKRYRRLLNYGNTTFLEGLIADYKAVSKPKLEKIVQEYQFCYADHQERLIIKDFISYLESVVKKLQEFLFLDENGGNNA